MYAKYAKLRDSAKLNDAQVALQTGIPRSTFTDWKQGRSAPKVEKLIKIADLFGVTLDELAR